MPLCRTSFQINLFLPLEALCCRLRIFCFTDSWENTTKFRVDGSWSATHDLGGITFRKKENGLCFRRMLWKSSLIILVYKFSFLNTSNIYRINNNYCFRPRWKPLRARVGDCCLKSFKEKQIILYLTTTYEKTIQLTTALLHHFCDFFFNVWVVSGRR